MTSATQPRLTGKQECVVLPTNISNDKNSMQIYLTVDLRVIDNQSAVTVSVVTVVGYVCSQL